MRVINLYGELGVKFGKSFSLDVKTPAEAIRALCVIIKGFESYILDSEKLGIGFKVFDSKNQINHQELGIFGNGDISIVPEIFGSSAESRIIVGSVLIAASMAMTASGFGASAAPYVMNAGIAMAIGGGIELLAGKQNAISINEKQQNKPSYIFNGAVNTTAQGHPVPVGYGRLIVGSAVISAAISTQNLMAGWVKKTVVKTVDIFAKNEMTNYLTRPPESYFKKELISTTTEPAPGDAPSDTLYKFRFYYYAEVMELAPL